MLIPIAVPTVIVVLSGIAWKRGRRPPVMTDDQAKIYKAALSGSLKDPEKMRKLADAFAREGFTAQATLLRKRARLRELPEATKHRRRQIFRDAMKSKNSVGIRKLADAYEKEGCTAAATRLREYASGLPQS